MALETALSRFAIQGLFAGLGSATAYVQRSTPGTAPNITCKTGETGVAKAVPLLDDEGAALDLSEWGDKILVIERANRPGDIQVEEEGDGLTINSNEFIFTPNATVLANAGDFKWSLREVSSGEDISQGRLAVSYSPMEDTP